MRDTDTACIPRRAPRRRSAPPVQSSRRTTGGRQDGGLRVKRREEGVDFIVHAVAATEPGPLPANPSDELVTRIDRRDVPRASAGQLARERRLYIGDDRSQPG